MHNSFIFLFSNIFHFISKEQILLPPPPHVFLCPPNINLHKKMVKIWIEVCIISARGLGRSSLLWKQQWFAVGYIDSNNKYCTRVDACKNSNPVWKTKFSTCVDSSESDLHDLELKVEVYSREPILLREKLQGIATIGLREFIDKYEKDGQGLKEEGEQVGSFQLRKRNSSKPQGFVDVSVKILEERGGENLYQGNEEGIELINHNKGKTLTLAPTPHAYPSKPLGPSHQPWNQPQANSPRTHQRPFPATNYPIPPIGGPVNYPPRTPPPPPQPYSNAGYRPSFLPETGNYPPTSYGNIPSSSGRTGRPEVAMGLGAGALAAGAMIFGNDFLSGLDNAVGIEDYTITINTNPFSNNI